MVTSESMGHYCRQGKPTGDHVVGQSHHHFLADGHELFSQRTLNPRHVYIYIFLNVLLPGHTPDPKQTLFDLCFTNRAHTVSTLCMGSPWQKV